MDITLLLDVIFAWASVVLAVLAAVIWILRILLKKRIVAPGSALGRAHRSLRLSHIWIGIAFIFTSVMHAIFSSVGLFSLNYGTLTLIVGVLLAAMYMIKKRVSRFSWLTIHRLLTVMLVVLLGLHIYDVGGAPATTQLIAEISGTAQTAEASDQLLMLASDVADTTDSKYIDGTYTGVADGFGPDLTVEVTIEGGEITDIQIVSHNEVGAKYYASAMVTIPEEIIAAQSVDVDSVSGATYTSMGIKNAVADALSQATSDGSTVVAVEDASLQAVATEAVEEVTQDTTEEATFADGTYTGVADGYGPDLTVEVTIEGGLITDIQIVSHNEHGSQFYGPAMETVPDEIIAAQSVEVDSVSGSTYTSVGIKNAVADALTQALISGEAPATETVSSSGGQHGNRRGSDDD